MMAMTKRKPGFGFVDAEAAALAAGVADSELAEGLRSGSTCKAAPQRAQNWASGRFSNPQRHFMLITPKSRIQPASSRTCESNRRPML
jgi:uncharacterized caspase-like protein